MKPYRRAIRLRRFFRISILCPLAAILALATGRVSKALADDSSVAPVDAIHFVGQVATVCGVVASAKYASQANGQPTFLNLDKPYPDHVFTAVIWGRDRQAFSYNPESLAARRICVTGAVRLYRSKPEIVVSQSNQIRTTN